MLLGLALVTSRFLGFAPCILHIPRATEDFFLYNIGRGNARQALSVWQLERLSAIESSNCSNPQTITVHNPSVVRTQIKILYDRVCLF